MRDLGLHVNLADMPGTLIEGVTDERLFAMIRRFNKVSTTPCSYNRSHIV